MTDKVTDKVTEKELKVIKLLIMNPAYTLPKIANKINVSRKTVAQLIKSLKEKGIIERISSDRKGYWKIK